MTDIYCRGQFIVCQGIIESTVKRRVNQRSSSTPRLWTEVTSLYLFLNESSCVFRLFEALLCAHQHNVIMHHFFMHKVHLSNHSIVLLA